MMWRSFRSSVLISSTFLCLFGCLALAQSSSGSSSKGQQGSSSAPTLQMEKAPSLVDPAGPTISLISLEPVFAMAAALNACGYDDGLDESAPCGSGSATR